MSNRLLEIDFYYFLSLTHINSLFFNLNFKKFFCYEISLNEPKIYISLEKDSPNGFVEIWKAGNKMKVTLINLKIAKLTTPASNFQLFVKTFFFGYLPIWFLFLDNSPFEQKR